MLCAGIAPVNLPGSFPQNFPCILLSPFQDLQDRFYISLPIFIPLPLRERGGGAGSSLTEGQRASMPILTRVSPQPLHEVTARSIPRLVTAPHRFSNIGAISPLSMVTLYSLLGLVSSSRSFPPVPGSFFSLARNSLLEISWPR